MVWCVCVQNEILKYSVPQSKLFGTESTSKITRDNEAKPNASKLKLNDSFVCFFFVWASGDKLISCYLLIGLA